MTDAYVSIVDQFLFRNRENDETRNFVDINFWYILV